MKKLLPLLVCVLFSSALFAQDTLMTTTKKKPNIRSQSNDHLLVQFGYTGWANAPDSVKDRMAGLSKSFNIYLMLNFPFKTNPKLSMAIGPGIGSDHIVFTKTYVGIKDLTNTIAFTNRSDTNHFKKTKLATTYLEAPIEFRYTQDPSNPRGSFKFAIGVKVGMLINAHTRNTKFQNRNENSLNNDYAMKEFSKRFFNKNRLVGTVRAGLGNFSIYGSYQLTTLFKDGFGPQVRPFSIGLTLSGL